MSAEISANWKYSIYPQNSVGRKHQILFLALQEFGLVGHLTCEIVIKRASEVIKIIQSPTIYHAKPRNAIRILKAVKKSIIPKSLLCWLYSRQYKVPTCKCCQEKAWVHGAINCPSGKCVLCIPEYDMWPAKEQSQWEAVVGMNSFRRYSVPFWYRADKGEVTDRHRNRLQYVAICFPATAESHPNVPYCLGNP